MKRILAGLGSCAMLMSAGTASAAPAWSTPQAIGGEPVFGQRLLALPGGGIALTATTGLSFAVHPPANPTPIAPVPFTAEISPSGLLGPLAALGTGQSSATLLPDGAAHVIAIGQAGLSNRQVSSAGRPGQPFGTVRSLHVANGRLLSADGGAVLISRYRKHGTDLAVLRRRGADWSTPRAITKVGDRVRDGDITTLPDHEIAVAYERDHAVYLRRLAPSGRLSPAQRVGTGVQTHIAITSAGGHRVIVTWAWQRINEGYASSGFHVRAACSNSIGHFSGRSRTLASIPVTGEGRYVDGPGLMLGQDSDRRHTLAWTGYANGRFAVQTGQLGARCAITPQTIALPGSDSVLGGLAVAPSGAATIAIVVGRRGADPPRPNSNPSEATTGIYAARRSSQVAPFAAPVQVSNPGENAAEPAVAIDHASGRVTLAWRNIATSMELASAP